MFQKILLQYISFSKENKQENILIPSCFLITQTETEGAFIPAVYALRVTRQHRHILCPLTSQISFYCRGYFCQMDAGNKILKKV